ncbi:S1 family peptidase [Nitrospira sp. NS4]|uniref:S1 family peptidase n=1 Tax=Nitrospira sp. NS4 TaxID=3414498 RepID=UPI003C2D364D
MKYSLLLIVFLTTSALGLSEYSGVQAMTLDDLSVTVAYLKEGKQIGTGFFVAAESPGLGIAEQPYLVTAAHVARFLTGNSTVTVRAAKDIPVSILLKELLSDGGKLAWQVHSESDVAVLRLKLDSKTLPLMQGRFLSVALLAPEEGAPQRERPVTVMGFPLALGTAGRFSPITSEAKPASGLLRLFSPDIKKEATFFVLDKPSIGGFSGGPVFQMPEPFASSGGLVFPDKSAPTTVVGLVHGTISDDTGGKLAAVVPSKFIRDTILQAERAE